MWENGEHDSPLSSEKEKQMSRRTFLEKTAKGVAFIAATGSSVPLLLSACAPKQVKKGSPTNVSIESMVDLGALDEIKRDPFPLKVDYDAKLKDGWTKANVKGFVYISKNEKEELLIMSPVCTHLGCTVPTSSEADKAKGIEFKCPCHGGEYDKQGINVGGPPPRPFDLFNPVIQNGHVFIQVLSPIKRTGKA